MKDRILKELRLPKRATALTLLAIVLVVSMPAAMAAIDYAVAAEEYEPVDYDEEGLISVVQVQNGDQWSNMAADIFRPSETDGSYYISAGTAGDGFLFSPQVIPSPMKSGEIGRIVITTPMDVAEMYYNLHETRAMYFTEEEKGVWILDIPIADALLIARSWQDVSESFAMKMSGWPEDGVLEFTIGFYGRPNVVYYTSTIIAAIAGLGLIVCALYATPWINAGGRS